MSRTRASAKAAGSDFERKVADYLAQFVDDRVDRRVKTGAKDKGDIAGLRTLGPVPKRVVVEVKNVTRLSLGTWLTEAEVERQNDDALLSVVVHKRHGIGAMGDQYVTCTLRDFVALMTERRPW